MARLVVALVESSSRADDVLTRLNDLARTFERLNGAHWARNGKKVEQQLRDLNPSGDDDDAQWTHEGDRATFKAWVTCERVNASISSPESAASGACERLEKMRERAGGDVVDVVWFASHDDERERVGTSGAFEKDPATWTRTMMAAYGTMRRAKEVFGEKARCRVCAQSGEALDKGAIAVADAVGASATTFDRDEIVDVGERFRGSLTFVGGNGRERLDLVGARATRLDFGAKSDKTFENDEDEDESGAREIKSSSAVAADARGMENVLSRACALRVVEIVHAQDVPSVYLSPSPSLRLRFDDVPESRVIRRAFFSAWSTAVAEASTPGDVPAMVVKCQWRLSKLNDSVKQQYRDFTDEDGAVPLLLYPVRRLGGGVNGESYIEFHLRPLATTAELLRRLSASAGASGLNKLNVAIDSMSKLAREDALEEAERALNMLSDRQSVKIEDFLALSEDEEDRDSYCTDDEAEFKDAESNLPSVDTAISPDIGVVKKSKMLSAIAAAFRGTAADGGEGSDVRAEYTRLWKEHVKYHLDPACVLPPIECARDDRRSKSSSSTRGLKYDDIIDRLMEMHDSSALGVACSSGQDGVEGFYTETFSKSIDLAISQLDVNTAAVSILRNVGVAAKDVTLTSAREKSFLQLMGETDEDARAQRRAERVRQIEEKREKTYMSLGIRRVAGSEIRRSEANTKLEQRRAEGLARAAAPDRTACPNPECAINLALEGANGQRLKFCYECGTKL